VSHRPALLLYCQHSLGLGHLQRSWALASHLAEAFRVTLVSGGKLFSVNGDASVDGVKAKRQQRLIEIARHV
jgi:predicted glycosyltransferase